MPLNVEQITRNQPPEEQFLDVFRKRPDNFIPIEDLRNTHGWSFGFAKHLSFRARNFLANDALYTIVWEKGFVYEPKKAKVGERIVPSGLRPDPNWLLSEFPDRRDLRDLLKRLRFATVLSDTQAKPLLNPTEHFLLIRLMADMASRQVSSIDNLRMSIPKLSQKLIKETEGEWAVIGERCRGLFYILKHNIV